jgi:hypothetical protein
LVPCIAKSEARKYQTKYIYGALKYSTEAEEWMNPMHLFLGKGEEERNGNDG